MQPDEPQFPETEQLLSELSSGELSADAKARHLYKIRERAAELGPVSAPQAQEQGARNRVGRQLETLRWRGRRAAAVASITIGSLSLGTGVAAAAAMDDLPGEPLYGLKRAVEIVRLYLPGDQSSDVQRRLDLAQRRIEEAEALRAEAADGLLLAKTVADAHHMIDEAGKRADGNDELTATVARSGSRASQRLGQLLADGLPEQASEQAREAIERASERAKAHSERLRERRHRRGGASETASPHDSRPRHFDRRSDESASPTASPSETRSRRGVLRRGERSETPQPSPSTDDNDGRNPNTNSSSGSANSSSGSTHSGSGSGDGDTDDDD